MLRAFGPLSDLASWPRMTKNNEEVSFQLFITVHCVQHILSRVPTKAMFVHIDNVIEMHNEK